MESPRAYHQTLTRDYFLQGHNQSTRHNWEYLSADQTFSPSNDRPKVRDQRRAQPGMDVVLQVGDLRALRPLRSFLAQSQYWYRAQNRSSATVVASIYLQHASQERMRACTFALPIHLHCPIPNCQFRRAA